MEVMTSKVKYYQLRRYRVMGVMFRHFGSAESEFELRLFILSTYWSRRSWPQWWNITNFANIGSWVSCLGILGVLNPNLSSDYSSCRPTGHGGHNLHAEILATLYMFRPIPSSNYSFCWPPKPYSLDFSAWLLTLYFCACPEISSAIHKFSTKFFLLYLTVIIGQE